MNPFIEQYNDHPLQTELVHLISAAVQLNGKLEDPNQKVHHDRLISVLDQVKQTLEDTDPLLVSTESMNSIHRAINVCSQNHTQFVAARNISLIDGPLEGLLKALAGWPRMPEGAKAFADTLEKYRSSSEERLKTLREEVSKVKTILADQKKRIDGFDNLLNQAAQTLEQQKGRLDQLITAETTRFSQAEAQRNENAAKEEHRREEQFAELGENCGEQLSHLLEEAKGTLSHTLAESGEKSDQALSDLEGLKQRATTIVGIIANTGLTGNYQKIANREWRSALVFQVLAAASFVLMAGIVAWVVKDVKAADFNWQIALFRLGVAITLVAPAFYFARESSFHRSQEIRNRRIELELASLNPFLETMPPEKVHAITEYLAKCYFGHDMRNGESDQTNLLAELKKLPVEELVKLVEPLLNAAKK